MTSASTGTSAGPRAGVVVALGLLGLAGVLGAAIVTRAGAGLDADSVTYLDAAQNLARGHGLTLTPGLSVESNPLAPTPFTHHPPLFPAILAVFERAGVDALAGARWLNALLLGVNGILVGLMVLKWTGSGRLAILGTLLVMGSVDVFKTHAWVLTEPIFLTGVLAGLWALALDLERPRHLAMAGAVVAIALATLARYAGLALVGTGAIAIGLWSPLRPAQRWTRATLFAAAAGAPLAAWLARNRATEGALTGKQLVFHVLAGDRARQGLDTISAWVLPDIAPRAVRYSGLVLVALLVLAAYRHARGRADTDPAPHGMRVGARLLGLFALLYGSLVYATISFFDANVPLDGRLLAPLYATAVVLALAGVARLSVRAPGVRSLALGAMVLLAGVSLTRTGLWAVGSQLDEMGYASRLWRESALVAEVKALRDDVRVFSNAPDALYVLTGRPARLVPLTADPFTRQANARYAEDFGRLEQDLRGRSGVVVYFRWLRWRWYLPSERELAQRLGLVTVATSWEGAMYGAPD